MLPRGLLLWGIAVVPGWLLAQPTRGTSTSPPSRSAPPLLDRVLRDTTLPNGLTLITVENHTVPLVTAEVVVRTGAFTQDSATAGVPHLFEHMLFRSYTGDAGESFAQDASDLNAQYNGTTSDEQVAYYLTVPSASLDPALRLLSRLVRDPAFTQEDLDEERQIVVDEFARDYSDPQYRLARAVESRLWSTAWARKNALGDTAAIQGANPRRLRDIFHRYYLPNNAALVISGDIDPERAIALARHQFSSWHAGADPLGSAAPAAIPALARSTVVLVEGPVQTVTVRVEWQGPSAVRDRADTYAADVLSSILDARGSAFQRRLVDSGLFTSLAVSYTTLNDEGPITLTGSTVVDSLPRALAALFAAMGALDRADAFSDLELVDSKQARLVEAAFELDHPIDMTHIVADWWSTTGLPYYRTYTAQMAAVTRSDLARFARRYFIGQPGVVGLLLPQGIVDARASDLAAIAAQLPSRDGTDAAIEREP